jgi:hypothetical protein
MPRNGPAPQGEKPTPPPPPPCPPKWARDALADLDARMAKDARAEYYAQYVQAGWMGFDEIRRREAIPDPRKECGLNIRREPFGEDSFNKFCLYLFSGIFAVVAVMLLCRLMGHVH